MDERSIAAQVLSHWRKYHRKDLKGMTEAQQYDEALGRARLVKMEMAALELIGVDRKSAWVDLRNSMALTAPTKQ